MMVPSRALLSCPARLLRPPSCSAGALSSGAAPSPLTTPALPRHAAEHDPAAAQRVFDGMPADGVVPSRLHHNLLLQAYSQAGDLQARTGPGCCGLSLSLARAAPQPCPLHSRPRHAAERSPALAASGPATSMAHHRAVVAALHCSPSPDSPAPSPTYPTPFLNPPPHPPTTPPHTHPSRRTRSILCAGHRHGTQAHAGCRVFAQRPHL